MSDLSKQVQDASDSMFELIEFSLERHINGESIKGIYGVNVVKVREVVRMPKINPLNSRIKGMAGVFELRGVPIPVINLAAMLGDGSSLNKPDQKVIVTEFGVKRAGFIVDATHRIRRINWNQVMPPSADSETYITAMTLIENNEFLFILDFEKILSDLDATALHPPGSTSNQNFGMPNAEAMMAMAATMAAQFAGQNAQAASKFAGAHWTSEPTSDGPLVLLVDDSGFILKNTKIGLTRSGLNVITANNGKEAMEILEKYASGNWKDSKLAAVITDIEMPQMDGFTLTKKIREHSELGHLPIIIHSSLSGRATQDTGIALGANGYVVKNDIKNLVEALSEIIGWKPAMRMGA
jgi:two-component system, chemotaxis family, chemotaxis protein CheV